MTPSIPGLLHFVVPGSLTTLTGGFVYDRRIIESLRDDGIPVEVTELREPRPSEAEAEALRVLPPNRTLVMDGLSLPHLAELLRSLPHRVFVLVHHPCSFEPRVEDRAQLAAAERTALAAADGLLATSHHTARMLAELDVDPTSVRVVHPATDARTLHDTPKNPIPRLLCVASLTHRKGHDLLLDALEGFGHPLSLDLVGGRDFEADWANAIERRIGAWSGPATLSLRGSLPQPEVDRLLSAADLFVFPSRYEGFGMAPLEAIRAGVPVLATRAGALPEALPPGAAHLVAPTADGIRKGLLHCLIPENAERLRTGARDAAGSLRTWKQAGAEFADALRTLGWTHGI